MGVTNNIIKETIVEVSNELSLKKIPTIDMKYADSNAVMCATGTVYASGRLFEKRITRTECDYVLHINKYAVNNMMKRYSLTFGNKRAAYDAVYLLICHELRHMWQYQEQYQVGSTYNDFDFTELSYGHGAVNVEIDANDFMLKMAKRKGIQCIAEYMEMEQRSNGLLNRTESFYSEIRKQLVCTTKQYNKVQYLLYKVLM